MKEPKGIQSLLPVILSDGKNAITTKDLEHKFEPSQIKIIQDGQETPQNPLIRNIDNDTLEEISGQVRKKAVLFLGLKGEENINIEAAIIEQIAATIRRYPNNTIAEIWAALDKGLRGEYLMKDQSFVHFSISNFSIWIETYVKMANPIKITAHNKASNILSHKPAEISREEQIRMASETVTIYVRNRIQKPDSWTLGNSAPLLKSLHDLGLYTPTDEEKKQAWNKAKRRWPKKKDHEIKSIAMDELYNRFIDSLAAFEIGLDSTGKQVPIDEIK